jgi:hypothetical protein
MVFLELSAELSPLDNYGFPTEQTNRGPQRDEIRDDNR